MFEPAEKRRREASKAAHHDVRRTATVAALGEVRLWSLERDVFLGVLGRRPGPEGGLAADADHVLVADAGLIV